MYLYIYPCNIIVNNTESLLIHFSVILYLLTYFHICMCIVYNYYYKNKQKCFNYIENKQCRQYERLLKFIIDINKH